MKTAKHKKHHAKKHAAMKPAAAASATK